VLWAVRSMRIPDRAIPVFCGGIHPVFNYPTDRIQGIVALLFR